MVTTTENEYILNLKEGSTRWLVELNDGTTCYQDDGRPDCPDISGWERLRNYCQAENKYIVKLSIQFRRETIALPTGKDGYYFCNSILSWVASGITSHYFVVGYIEDGKILTKKYKIPELILVEDDVREIRMDDICLISKGQSNGN